MVSKRQAKIVIMQCVKCQIAGTAYEKSIWVCDCGQANAVLAAGTTEAYEPPKERKPKEKTVEKQEFWAKAEKMLKGLKDEHPEWKEPKDASKEES